MHRFQTQLAGLLLLVPSAAIAADFSGPRALAETGKLVGFGPRPSGSAALENARAYILAQLKSARCQLSEDKFTATTPIGPVPMDNLIARFPGTSGRAIVITGHYDTKRMPGAPFVGANDGGSSAGLLLEMAHALAGTSRKDDVYLVWFDGEEAVFQWSDTDSVYGSKHLADVWRRDGTLARIRALINVDMTGDKDLGILRETNSSQQLNRTVWSVASSLGYGKYFLNQDSAIEDDHIPFLRMGVNAADLIDFDYGPDHSWWHQPSDTMDKLSANSFEVVGRVLVEMIRRLEQ